MRRGIGLLVVLTVFVVLAAVGFYAWKPYWSGAKGRTTAAPSAPATAPGRDHGDSVAHEGGYWTCAMHPQVHSDKPGNCPICGMELYFRKNEEPGVVSIEPKMRELLGIVAIPVKRDTASTEIRAVARVMANERKIYHVATRVDGWVEDLMIDFAGQRVEKGQPLLTIYSPELFASEEEYAIALEARDRLASSTDTDARTRAQALLRAAEERLELFNVPADERERLRRTRQASRNVTLYAPASGFVVDMTARRGMQIMPSQTIFNIADLSTVWIIADVYENEMTGVREGMPADIRINQLPGETLAARVDYVFPFLDPDARTNRVRVTLPNPDLALRPGMYGNMTLRTQGAAALMIPIDAVIRTGTRDVVYVETKPGSFTAREVKLGAQINDRYIVLEGLEEGEMVVAIANYFIDSEASIRSAGAAGAAPDSSTPGASKPGMGSMPGMGM